jgi:hypothetical protein
LERIQTIDAAWPDRQIVQAASAQLSWHHNIEELEIELSDVLSGGSMSKVSSRNG